MLATYRHVGRPLTVFEARYLLEPVLNLARLQIRTDQGNAALRLLESMFQAVTRRSDLVVADQTLPLATSAAISRTAASYANGSGSNSSAKASARSPWPAGGKTQPSTRASSTASGII